MKIYLFIAFFMAALAAGICGMMLRGLTMLVLGSHDNDDDHHEDNHKEDNKDEDTDLDFPSHYNI